jgi:hypothetical protein
MMKHFGTLSGVRRGCYPATANLSEKANIWGLYRGDFMSALGHKRTFCGTKVMSALPPKADLCGANKHVCFGPKAYSDFYWEIVKSYAQLSRSRIALPITQSLSSSDRNESSSVK